ncbi:MAG TPA: BadF/BadG/BcrA/BcrD ATPase family protein [Longimicrobiales bacterium]|nr:BadF/BadG/BcrA/BcrD ATPase family protein [Longimicrobiales bacterium]
MPTPDDLLVGIDGGATRTRVLVGRRGGGTVTRLDGAGSLVRASAPEAGVDTLARHVRDTLDLAGRQPPAYALCCALAGAGRADEQRRVQAALQPHGLASRLRVIPDVEAAFHDAFHGHDGILLLSGTGSIAIAAHAGRSARAGGWGSILGDEGSGFAIGRAALAGVARAHDGRGPATVLTDALLHQTACPAPEALIAWTDRADKADIAALAPCVLAAPTDPVAAAILDDAAEQLAAHVRALYARLGPWRRPPALAFAGGTLAAPSTLRDRIVQRLQAASATPVTPLAKNIDAARGALGLAASL